MDAAGEAGENDAARSRAAEVFEARNDGAFRRSEAWALDVGGIREKSEHAFVSVACKGMKVEAGAVDGCLVDLEVAGVDDDAERRANRERNAVDRAVRNGNKFDLERINFDEAAGCNFAEGGGVEEAGFLEALFDKC